MLVGSPYAGLYLPSQGGRNLPCEGGCVKV